MPPPPLSEQFWDARHPPANPTHLSFKGKTILVTGANTGMGFQAALKYAQLGTSTLILAVRDANKGEAAKARIMHHVTTGVDIIIKTVDLSTFDSVKAFAQDINENIPELHVVQLCAGIMSPSFTTGAEGYENSFQINVLSTALMVILLLEKVQKTATAGPDDGYIPHITFLNSVATQDVLGEWIPEDQTLVQRINDATKFDHVSQYYLVKLAARYFIEGLAAHCSKSSPRGETNVIVNCSCPAMCRGTDLHRGYPWYVRLLLIPYKFICGRDPEHGSRTLVSAAGLGRESNGKFWFNDALPEHAGFMATERNESLYKETNEEILTILREKAGLKGHL
ncbi:short-chain dehydrogenase/reductase [Xylaria longipes]|nr:short-chain dehydrogenase/reductase [Xylaria longipes]